MKAVKRMVFISPVSKADKDGYIMSKTPILQEAGLAPFPAGLRRIQATNVMTLIEAIRARHSVRSYTSQRITGETKEALEESLAAGSAAGNVSLKLVTDSPSAFNGLFSRCFGNFRGVSNYITLSGPDTRAARLAIGYYGESTVLLAQQLGLNTCWAGLSFSRGQVALQGGEKLHLVIAIGYGTTQGGPRKSKRPDQVATCPADAPAWFWQGIDAALLAPTACNMQKFHFTLLPDGRVDVQEGRFFFSVVDLGIVRRHFEIGAGTDFVWARPLLQG